MAINSNHTRLYKFLDYVNLHVSSDTQRLVMGLTAIATQPLIDLANTNVDKETRWTSVMRTIAKIAVGTTVGVIVRRGAINIVKNNKAFWGQKGNKAGIPVFPEKNFWKNVNPNKKDDMEKLQYANTFGTVIGTLAGLVTNFAVDAPLSAMFTNYLNENVKPICMDKFEKSSKKDNEVTNV